MLEEFRVATMCPSAITRTIKNIGVKSRFGVEFRVALGQRS